MSFTYNDAHTHLPRRNARSFDLDDSAAKAAAWVWHLHTSKPGITTEGRFISSQTKRRSSGSYDRKASRFQQEASSTTKDVCGKTTPMWDCGSNLYDTFELVAFGNSLDRSLLETVPTTPPTQAQHPQDLHMVKPPPLHAPSCGIRRTQSLPRSPSSCHTPGTISSSSDMDNKLKLTRSCNHDAQAARAGSSEKASRNWSSLAKFVSAIKNAVVARRSQVMDVGCKKSINVMESSQIKPTNIEKGIETTIDSQLSRNPKIRGRLVMENLKGNEGMDDGLVSHSPSFRYNYFSDNGARYRLSIPSAKDKFNYGRNRGHEPAMPQKIRAVSTDTLDGGYSTTNQKIRSKSESLNDERNTMVTSNGRRMYAEDKGIDGSTKDTIKDPNYEFLTLQKGIKGGDLGANYGTGDVPEHQQVDVHKHLHHHHHHHHHHHYVHHNLASESARFCKEAVSHTRTEQSWLI